MMSALSCFPKSFRISPVAPMTIGIILKLFAFQVLRRSSTTGVYLFIFSLCLRCTSAGVEIWTSTIVNSFLTILCVRISRLLFRFPALSVCTSKLGIHGFLEKSSVLRYFVTHEVKFENYFGDDIMPVCIFSWRKSATAAYDMLHIFVSSPA